MKKDSELYKLIKAQVFQHLREERLSRLFEADDSGEDIFSDPNSAADAQPSQKPSTDVDMKKVSSTSKTPPASGESGEQAEEASLGKIIEKLNTIRSGRSFKDNDILAEMTRYFNDLTTAERSALLAFLTGISQIVTAGVAGTSALEPEDPPLNIKMHQHSPEKTRKIQPVVIKKSQPAASSPPPSDRENTAPPVPITPKKK